MLGTRVAKPRHQSGQTTSIFRKNMHLIDSNLLGERIVLVDRDLTASDACCLYPDCVVYTHAEVGKLLELPEETVRDLHGIKKCFHGRISFVSKPVETTTVVDPNLQ